MRSRRARARAAAPPAGPRGPEERVATVLLLALNVALEIALVVAAITLARLWQRLGIPPGQKLMFLGGIAAALLTFGWRAVRLARRLAARD
jgi:hypothetical protein